MVVNPLDHMALTDWVSKNNGSGYKKGLKENC